MTVNTDLLMALIIGDAIERASCRHAHTAFEGSVRFVGGELIDDIREVCTECGAYVDEIETESEEFDGQI